MLFKRVDRAHQSPADGPAQGRLNLIGRRRDHGRAEAVEVPQASPHHVEALPGCGFLPAQRLFNGLLGLQGEAADDGPVLPPPAGASGAA